ncbi:MAG: glycosyltransferase 61 family protein [Alphaproteobacteria bacterium]|nr:glycosyltransferase 61 family protein [Alphaproteobacteria bacterium]
MRLPIVNFFRLSPGTAEIVFYRLNHIYYKLVMNGLFRKLANPVRARRLFNARFYTDKLGFSLPPSSKALRHFLTYGIDHKIDPHPLFDTQLYVKCTPGVSTHRLTPFEHFIWFGGRAGRIPLSLDARDAEERIQQALALDPGNPMAMALLFGLHLKQNRLDDARQQLDTLLPVLNRQKPSLLHRYFGWESNALASSLVQAFPYLMRLQDEKAVADICGAVLRLCGLLCRKALVLSIAKENQFDKKILESFFASYASLKPCLSVKDFCEKYACFYRDIWPERPITPPQLQFLVPPPPLEAECGDLTSYPLSIGVLTDVTAYSNSNTLYARDVLVGDGFVHRRSPDSVFVDNIRSIPIIIGVVDKATAIADLPRTKPRRIESGLQMFGAQTQNYGHWFLEYLPRMLAYDDDLCPPDYPIIVDNNMPPTSLAALDLLNIKRRKVIALGSDEVLQFDRLGVASMPAFFPCDVFRMPVYDTVWPADIFIELRRRILEVLKQRNISIAPQKRRLFISRKNYGFRKLVNENEVWEFLAAQGFEKILPETLSFAEQVLLFHSAEIIAGSCSSAMTNTLFCQPGSQIIGFINETLSFNFNGYASFNCSGGADMLFIRGENVASDYPGHPYHRDYQVPLSAVKDALDRAEAALAAGARKSA